MQAIFSLFSGCLRFVFKRPSFSGFVMTHSLKASFILSTTAKDLKLSATASGLFTGYIVYFYQRRVDFPEVSSLILEALALFDLSRNAIHKMQQKCKGQQQQLWLLPPPDLLNSHVIRPNKAYHFPSIWIFCLSSTTRWAVLLYDN